MSNSLPSAHRLTATRLAAICLAVIALGVLASGAISRLWPAGVTSAGPPPVAPRGIAPVMPAQSSRGAEVEIVTLSDSGFEPAQITRPAGRFLLAVNDKASLDEVDFVLKRDAGPALHHARVARGGRNWRKTVELAPGAYLLTEADHPDWVCRITITP
jgi:hypothetical protein